MFLLRSFNEVQCRENETKLIAGGEKAVNHQTAISAGVFLQYYPLYSEFVFLSSEESRTEAYLYLEKNKAIIVPILFEEEVMISFLEDHFCWLLWTCYRKCTICSSIGGGVCG